MVHMVAQAVEVVITDAGSQGGGGDGEELTLTDSGRDTGLGGDGVLGHVVLTGCQISLE